ncbi:uncharacterized protein LOC120436202 [Oreochromis aureus]|uniref:Macro domain-containing protein n=1 Tax=Oreochromis aureus TaxID=47969 RepID=A0AAZ1XHV1_OREAU|nr:uncharacterized protein LOC120436202 [Oreochromis aureus]
MDKYTYPLFFEAKGLSDNDIQDIWRYFQRGQDSGGGECGIPGEVDGNTYKICFKDKEVQERVLLRKFHAISISGGKQYLTVSQTSLPPQTLNQSSTSQSQAPTKVITKHLEKTFNIDIFLLYYLRDKPKALKILQKQLSYIGCTVELKFEDENVVVRGDSQSQPGECPAEKKEQQLDQIFSRFNENYLCYHVFEPKQIKMLLQDSSLKIDDIKVYNENGYAVVVGEVHAVKEKIADLENIQYTKKELPIVEKHYRLIEEEFNREMCANYPDVKVVRGSATITLEGSDTEVQSGAAKLDELIKNIKENRVKFPTALLTFIKTSGAISKYQARFQQSLRNPVFFEVGSDLVLSSLSSDALNEAEAAVMREFKVATVQLQGAAAVPPDLDRVKEILMKAKKEANISELRVDVSFMPGVTGTTTTKVRLVGYSEDVNKLNEVLHGFQKNEVDIQEVLNLPHPELVDCFDKVLDLIGMKQTKVTLKASHVPHPCVLVMGPRSLVQKVQADLAKSLAQLSTDTVVLNGPAVQLYFQEEGRKNKEVLERSCQVIIREQQEVYSQSTASVLDLYPEPLYINVLSSNPDRLESNTASSTPNTTAVNKTNLEIKLSTLEDEQVNVVVAPMVSKKLTSTKVGKCLLKKAGNPLQKVFDLIARRWTLSAGNVMVVDAPPALSCSKIFFIECLQWDGVDGLSMQTLANGLKRCLELCVKEGWCSVAFPIIGPGVILKYPQKEAIQVLTDSIHQFGLSGSCGSLHNISVVIKPDYQDSEECYQEVYRQLSLKMKQRGQVTFKSLKSDLADVTIKVGGVVELQLVFGDIVNETTDAVVNSTNFTNFQGGVCRKILTMAGPQVEAELRNAKVKKGDILKTPPGGFPCKAILHVCGEKNVSLIEKQLFYIIQLCESSGYKSVALPAICAGSAGLDPNHVAYAILQGVKTAASFRPLQCLTNIRLVLNKLNVFLAFKKRAMQMFPSTVINTVVSHAPPVMNIHPSILSTSSRIQHYTFMIVGLCRKNVDNAIANLKSLYQAECATEIFRQDELAGLTQDDVNHLKQLIEVLGVHVVEDHYNPGCWTVSGLKDGVHQVMEMIRKSAT